MDGMTRYWHGRCIPPPPGLHTCGIYKGDRILFAQDLERSLESSLGLYVVCPSSALGRRHELMYSSFGTAFGEERPALPISSGCVLCLLRL